MINIILAEDHTIVRQGIKMLLQSDGELFITGEAASGQEVISQLETGIQADILLTDLDMPGMDGLALMSVVQNKFPHLKVIILSMKTRDEDIASAFNNGALGYLLKTTGSEEIIYAVKHVHRGKKYLCAELSQLYFERSSGNLLSTNAKVTSIEFTAREKEILTLVAEGLTNSEMSERLFLSKRTVEGQRQALIEKTGAKNTASLIKYAILNRLIK